MATNNGWNHQVLAANSVITLNSGVNAVSVSTDASATSVNIGTGAAAKTVTVGSTNGASASTLQSGTGALNVTATNGALTVNSGTGVLGISTDASATTVNIATGAAAKLATLGSTNGASSLALKYGTADFSLASATGNVIVALDSGEVTKPLQPAFLAKLSANTATNVTGDGTNYVVICNTEIYDQGNDYNNATGVFTAPVAGKYLLIWNVGVFNMGATHNTQIPNILTTARVYVTYNESYVGAANIFSQASFPGSVIADMAAGDTATFRMFVNGGAKTVGIVGGGPFGAGDFTTFVSGCLLC